MSLSIRMAKNNFFELTLPNVGENPEQPKLSIASGNVR